MSRSTFDLSHHLYHTGWFGQARVLDIQDVLPGDSLQASFTGSIRLSQLRRPMALDALFDFFSFFVPWRHVYGRDRWEEWIAGDDPARTLPDVYTNEGQDLVGNPSGKGGMTETFTQPLSGRRALRYWYAVLWIWDNYLRDPQNNAHSLREFLRNYGATAVVPASDMVGSTSSESLASPTFLRKFIGYSYGGNTAQSANYPIPICQLQGPRTVFAQDAEQSGITDYSVVSDKVSLPGLDEAKALLELDRRKQWYGKRYTELMQSMFGVSLSDEESYRPELLSHSSAGSKGYDVDATDRDGLGAVGGKAFAGLSHRIPRKFFMEHGCVITMALPRISLVAFDERPYLLDEPNPDWYTYGGQATLLATQPPVSVQVKDLYRRDSDSQVLGYWPSGHQFRQANNYVEEDFNVLQGFPFANFRGAPDELTGSGSSSPKSEANAVNHQIYCRPDELTEVFQTAQLKHWHSQVKCSMLRYSQVPPAGASIFAGTGGR